MLVHEFTLAPLLLTVSTQDAVQSPVAAPQVPTACCHQEKLQSADCCRPHHKGAVPCRFSYVPHLCHRFNQSCAMKSIICAIEPITCAALQLQEAFDLLGEQSDLQLELDGYTVLSNTPLSLFRDGDTVIIKSQKRPLSLPNGIHTEGDEQKFPEPAVALTAAGDHTTCLCTCSPH